MKILVLCYEYPPIGGGGGRIAQAIAGQLAARGHDVRVQTAALGTHSARETVAGVEVFRTASLREREDTCAVHEMALFCATSFLPTLRHIASWKPDVIHAHFAMPTGLLAWAAHSLTGVPYVLTAHLGDVPGGVPEQTDTLFRFIGPIARQVWRRAAAATAVSSFVQQLAERAYGRAVERILNGIDLADTPPPEMRCARHLIFVGRFNPQKRPLFLLDALARLQAEHWKLTIIGDGPLMADVKRRVRELHLESRVTDTGWLDAAAVQRLLREADILCMPSLSEGLPVAAIEALKHGLAIVGSDIPGMADVVENGVNGYLVAPHDTEAFAHKLDCLLRHEDTLHAMKRASWQKAHDFDLRAIAGQYESVLLRAAGK